MKSFGRVRNSPALGHELTSDLRRNFRRGKGRQQVITSLLTTEFLAPAPETVGTGHWKRCYPGLDGPLFNQSGYSYAPI